MLYRYKEIVFGFVLGVAMWIVDAAMHVQLGAEVHAPSSFLEELLRPGVVPLLFRTIFLVIAIAFGWALWRSNRRERELHLLEEAIIRFNRHLDSPAMRILNHTRMLQGRLSVSHDQTMRHTIESIGNDAHRINELAQQYLQFSEQALAGRMVEAVETLRAVERGHATSAAPIRQSV